MNKNMSQQELLSRRNLLLEDVTTGISGTAFGLVVLDHG